MRFLFLCSNLPEHRPLVDLFECGVIDSAHTYVWLFSASNSSPFPLLRRQLRWSWKTKQEIFWGGNAGQVLVNMLERKRNYTEVSHQMLTVGFKVKKRVEGNVCVLKKADLKKTYLTKWWDACTCTQHTLILKHTHPKLPPHLSMLVVVVSFTVPSQATNEWMENNVRASRAPGNG